MSAAPPGATLHTVGPSADPLRSTVPELDGDRYTDWDDIYSDNVAWVYRMMYAKVGNRPDAEDLTTDVFLAALRPLRTGAHRAEVRGYLAVTARSTLAGYWRRRLGLEITTIDPDTALRLREDPEPESGAGDRARRLLDVLPERYRRILELRFLAGLSVKEAADALGISVANAKVLQHRALRTAGRIGSAGPVGTD
jgi:RNA polymerase sigma-70 factor, ECF subfamily